MGTGLKQQVTQYLQQKASGSPPSGPAPSATPIPNVTLVSVSAHGSSDVLVAKVEVTVNGSTPPDGRSVRYLDLMRSVDGRWLVVADADAYHYVSSLLAPTLPKGDQR